MIDTSQTENPRAYSDLLGVRDGREPAGYDG
jgi:hypothetical protein